MSTLYEISSEMQELMMLVEASSEELTDEQKAQIDEFKNTNEAEAKKKVEGYCQVIKNKTASNKMLDEEIKRLQAKKKTNASSIDWLKNSLKGYFEANDIKTIDTFAFKVTLAGSGGALPLILDSKYKEKPEDLPEAFREEIPKSYKPDNDAIKKVLTEEQVAAQNLEEGEEAPESRLAGIAEFGVRSKYIKIS